MSLVTLHEPIKDLIFRGEGNQPLDIPITGALRGIWAFWELVVTFNTPGAAVPEHSPDAYVDRYELVLNNIPIRTFSGDLLRSLQYIKFKRPPTRTPLVDAGATTPQTVKFAHYIPLEGIFNADPTDTMLDLRDKVSTLQLKVFVNDGVPSLVTDAGGTDLTIVATARFQPIYMFPPPGFRGPLDDQPRFGFQIYSYGPTNITTPQPNLVNFQQLEPMSLAWLLIRARDNDVGSDDFVTQLRLLGTELQRKTRLTSRLMDWDQARIIGNNAGSVADMRVGDVFIPLDFDGRINRAFHPDKEAKDFYLQIANNPPTGPGLSNVEILAGYSLHPTVVPKPAGAFTGPRR